MAMRVWCENLQRVRQTSKKSREIKRFQSKNARVFRQKRRGFIELSDELASRITESIQ